MAALVVSKLPYGVGNLSLRWALLAIMPVAWTVLIVYAVLGYAGKDYDMPIAVLSTLVLGIGVDFAIHFVQRFRQMLADTGSARAALREFFQDFLKLFYPDVEARLRFQDIEFPETELFIDFPDGERHEADVVAKLETFDGSPELVLIHVEIQARPERDFEARMFEYYALLWSRYKIPIFPNSLVPPRRGHGNEPRGVPNAAF